MTAPRPPCEWGTQHPWISPTTTGRARSPSSYRHRNDRDIIPRLVDAFVEGYRMGRRARCLVGLDWSEIYARDLGELRAEWGITEAGRFPALQAAA